jgi:glycosyltransferase involved in cell wall biosynthesis
MIARIFLAHQINSLVKLYDVTIIANFDNNSSILDNISNKVNLISIPIERNINLLVDLKALFLLTLIFYKKKFFVIHSVSPKAGLLTALAGWICHIPNRLHTFTGQVWVTKSGINRLFLKFLDKIIVTLNTNILVDSFTQQDFLKKENILSEKSSMVLGQGSICGVNLNRFQPSMKHKISIRNQLKINEECLVFIFIGRLKKDKGVFELIEAFKNVSRDYSNLALLIIGPDEERLKQELIDRSGICKEYIRLIGFTKSPEQFMAASDILVLPSYREGFGNVVIEAASCGLPSIGSNIYGLKDAIKDNETGILVPAKSSKLLEKAMIKLIDNRILCTKMSTKARKRAIHYFSEDRITLYILKLYEDLMNK